MTEFFRCLLEHKINGKQKKKNLPHLKWRKTKSPITFLEKINSF